MTQETDTTKLIGEVKDTLNQNAETNTTYEKSVGEYLSSCRQFLTSPDFIRAIRKSNDLSVFGWNEFTGAEGFYRIDPLADFVLYTGDKPNIFLKRYNYGSREPNTDTIGPWTLLKRGTETIAVRAVVSEDLYDPINLSVFAGGVSQLLTTTKNNIELENEKLTRITEAVAEASTKIESAINP